MEINEKEVYTTEEAQQYLKVSQSTVMRMIKNGLIQCAKVGSQYRILGKELLRIVSPQLEDKVGKLYNKGRRWVHDEHAPKANSQKIKTAAAPAPAGKERTEI